MDLNSGKVRAWRGRLIAPLSLMLLLVQPSWAQTADDAAFPQVPWADLMVNLPEADMDAYARELLQQSQLEQPLQADVPTPPAQQTVRPARAVTATANTSKLAMNEVVLSRADWLSEINQQADVALASNNWPLAELRLAQALGEYQDAHDTRLRLAGLLYGRGALDQARAVLQEGISVAPDYPDFRFILARLLAEQQRFEAAFEQLNQVNPALATHLDYYSLKAEVARRSGQCAQAVATYHQLLAYNGVGAWWLGLGLCQRDLGEDYRHAFKQARASADLGVASQRFVEQQLEQRAQDGQTQTN